MVRTLDGALTSAVNSVTRVPSLSLTVEDHVIHYASYQTPNTADAWNDLCMANDDSIIRVQVTRGGGGFTSNFQRALRCGAPLASDKGRKHRPCG